MKRVFKQLAYLISVYKNSFAPGMDVVEFYRCLGDDFVAGKNEGFSDPGKPLWQNNGYWKEAGTYPQACRAMARLLAEAAELSSGDKVLDAGFGFADQDFYWNQAFGISKIVGINVSPLQVEVARKRVKERGLENRIELHLGSAVDLPFEEESFDKVVALQSLFQFPTREKFFHDAFRVLHRGGKFAATDYLGDNFSGLLKPMKRRYLKQAAVPEQNMYGRETYLEKIQDAGFSNVSIRSIAGYVFPGMTKYTMGRLRGLDMESIVVELTEQEIKSCTGIHYWQLYGFSDYIIVSAEKP